MISITQAGSTISFTVTGKEMEAVVRLVSESIGSEFRGHSRLLRLRLRVKM